MDNQGDRLRHIFGTAAKQGQLYNERVFKVVLNRTEVDALVAFIMLLPHVQELLYASGQSGMQIISLVERVSYCFAILQKADLDNSEAIEIPLSAVQTNLFAGYISIIQANLKKGNIVEVFYFLGIVSNNQSQNFYKAVEKVYGVNPLEGLDAIAMEHTPTDEHNNGGGRRSV